MKFLNKNEYECPYCHKQLQDEVIDGKEVKVCKSDICMYQVGDKGRVWDSMEV